MNDLAFWEKYDKRKTSSTKSRMIRELVYTNDISTLDRLSQELLENRSSSIKEEGIKVLQILEQKFEKTEEIEKQDYYQRILAKYKISDFRNFWFKDFCQLSNSSILEYFEQQIQTKFNKNAKGKFKLTAQFNLGKHLSGYAFVNIGMQKPYEFSHLAYGFITDLVDYNGEMLNIYPFAQKHLQQIPTVGYKILRQENGAFEFNKIIKDEFNVFFKYLENHYDSLSNIVLEDLDNSNYVNTTKKMTNDSSGLWTLLSMINIAKKENKLERLEQLANIGQRLLGKKTSGRGWNEYFDKYVK